jgi:hypothetical protein
LIGVGRFLVDAALQLAIGCSFDADIEEGQLAVAFIFSGEFLTSEDAVQ